MNNLFVFLVILIAAPTVFGQTDENLCEYEYIRVLQEAQQCNPGNGYSLFQIQPTFVKLAVDQISKYQIRRYITNSCRTAFNDTACVRNVRIDPKCDQFPRVQLFKNFITIMSVQIDYMCAISPGSYQVRYLDWVNSDGAYCSADNKAVDFCINSGKARLGLSDENAALTANICTMNKIQDGCTELYKLCTNKKVYQYMSEISEILNRLYNCE